MIDQARIASALESLRVVLREERRTPVHFKIVEGCQPRDRQPGEKNAALELTGLDGEPFCRATFRGTNRAQTGQYAPVRRAMICKRFIHLANECAAT